MKDVSRRLTLEKINLRKHLIFDVYEFNAFRKSKNDEAFEFPLPNICTPLVAVPYMLVLEVILFRARRYFVTLDNQIVGLFAVEPRNDLLLISNLAVLPEARRHKVASYMLDQISCLASELGLTRLRLRVLKKNNSARLLYMKYGFKKKEESRSSLKLEKSLKNTCEQDMCKSKND